jgi:hypothetical protein
MSISDLAERLGAEGLDVGEHVVRDFERPRKGQPQRSFSWEEIVALCYAFDTTLFELVLPPEGLVHDATKAIAAAANNPDLIRKGDARYQMSWKLFGLPTKYTTPDKLLWFLEEREKETERRKEILQDAINRIFEEEK